MTKRKIQLAMHVKIRERKDGHEMALLDLFLVVLRPVGGLGLVLSACLGSPLVQSVEL